MGFFRRQTDATSPETSAGGPVYDARIDPAISGAQIVENERVAHARDVHLWGDKSAPAQLFSHYQEQQPSPLSAQLMGLTDAKQQIERVVSRKDLGPFPGVALGHVPGVHRSPDTNPILGGVQHLRHHAHQGQEGTQVWNAKRGRRVFGF